MTTLSATEASSKLYNLIDETVESHQPVTITGKKGNAVLISEEDWESISETLYLMSIPEMRQSIVEGIAEPISNCSSELNW